MTEPSREDRRAAVALAFLRTSLLVVIFVNEQLVDARQLADWPFFVVLSLASVYALGGVLDAFRSSDASGARALARMHPLVDVVLLGALAYTSGGAYSDVRKAFFVIPLAAAFSERARSTASWSAFAVVTFTLQAVAAGGHPAHAVNSWEDLTIIQDLYLIWTGAAATMLALALGRRTAQTIELSQSRQRLVTQAIESVERERTRLACALHDEPVQNLIAARHDLRRAERSGDSACFRRLHEAIKATIAQLREEIFNLHPHVLDHVGLSAALEQVARRGAGDTAVNVTVEIDPHAEAANRQVLFALGRELLGNALKHARASDIRLNVTRQTECVTLEVSDDGRGIPAGRMRQALLDGHIGLAAVRERVAGMRGALEIVTAPGCGTCVRVTLPAPRLENRSTTTAGQLAASAVAEISDRVTSNDTVSVSAT